MAGLSLAGAGTPAFAAVITWDGGGGNLNWGTANNWSGNALPAAGDDVVIDGAPLTNSPVVLNVISDIKTLTIDNGDGLSMSNGTALTITGASLTNNGAMAMNGAANQTTLHFQGSGTLGGTGTLSLSDNMASVINSNVESNVITNALGHTIQGSGRLLNNAASMLNNGAIKPTGAVSALVIDPGSAGFINKGVLQAVGTAGLRFDTGDFTNTGASIDVLTGSNLTLNGPAKVIGGTLTTAATGIINPNTGSILDGVTINGNVNQANGQGVNIQNGLTNNGIWSMTGAANQTTLQFQGSGTLGGTGTLSLSDNMASVINSNVESNVITNALGHTIQGSGRLLNNAASMLNNGAIKATGAVSALVIDPGSAGFDNKGFLRAQGTQGIDLVDGANTKNSSGQVEVGTGSRIDVTGNYLQTGGATVVEGGGLMTATGTAMIQGGRLGGNGVVDANVNNTGGVTGAGMSVGLLTIDGNYTQSALGTLEEEIDSLTSFDFIQVLGNASLDGFLNVIVNNLFAPSLTVGATFEILNAASISGTFSTLTDNFPELGFAHFIDAGSAGGRSVYLRVTEVNFPPPPPPPSSADVPEPATGLLFGAGLGGMAWLRRKLKQTA